MASEYTQEYLDSITNIRHEYWPNNGDAPFVSIDGRNCLFAYQSEARRTEGDRRRVDWARAQQ